MKAKLLYITDFHKRMKDITTIKGYVQAINMVEKDIHSFVKSEGITHVLIGGDWYDKGYGTDVASALAHTEGDRILYDLVNGNLYSVIGNHIRINMDSNPELSLIQPHPVFTTRVKVPRKHQIFRTPDKLIIGSVQVSFNHHNHFAKDATAYHTVREPGITYHIGLFHDERIIPTTILAGAGIPTIVTETNKITHALEDVDLAIVGHIHKPIGEFPIQLANGKICTMIVPGSLTNTDAGDISRHDIFKAPIIEIGDNSEVSLSYHEFDLHTDTLTFIKKNREMKENERLKTTRGNVVGTLYEDGGEITSLLGNSSDLFMSLNAFMEVQKYTDLDKNLMRSIMKDPANINSLLSLWRDKENNIEL